MFGFTKIETLGKVEKSSRKVLLFGNRRSVSITPQNLTAYSTVYNTHGGLIYYTAHASKDRVYYIFRGDYLFSFGLVSVQYSWVTHGGLIYTARVSNGRLIYSGETALFI